MVHSCVRGHAGLDTVLTCAAASIWRGAQSSGDASYDVSIRFHHIDLERTWTASGLLRIERLTQTQPVLTCVRPSPGPR